MSYLGQIPSKGDYCCSSHSAVIAGDIEDVFYGKWTTTQDQAKRRALLRFIGDEHPDDAELLCIVKLRYPLTRAEYQPVHHTKIRPLLRKVGGDKIEVVIVPAAMVRTIPASM